MKTLCSKTRMTKLLWLAGGIVIGAAVTQQLHAQQSNIQRMILLRADAPQATVPMQLVMGTVEIQAGTTTGRHTHAGVEIGYVLNGEAVMEVDGEASRSVRAGDSYVIPAARAHDVRITSKDAAKVLAVYLVQKDQPLATAAQ